MELAAIKGTVKSLRSISKYQAQIELIEDKGVFHLDIDQVWAIDKGDQVSIIFGSSDTGIKDGYAYVNHSKGTKGWRELFDVTPYGKSSFNQSTAKSGYTIMALGVAMAVVGYLIFPYLVLCIPGLVVIAFGFVFALPSKESDKEKERRVERVLENELREKALAMLDVVI
ncbi:hypothetical protein RUK27_003266 [Vibrio cholerae]|nr:hypothetical protein [Vibrio cholerae]ELJ8490964.1 hypothetical protein [Vibrio cholerae]